MYVSDFSGVFMRRISLDETPTTLCRLRDLAFDFIKEFIDPKRPPLETLSK